MFDIALDDLGTLAGRPWSFDASWPNHRPIQSFDEVPTSGWMRLELDLATGDPGLLSDGELVDAVVGFERMAAFMMARQAEVLAEFARRRPADDLESARSNTACPASPYAADEIGLALHLTRGTAAARIAQAQRLDGELRATRRAWRDGELDAGRVRVICNDTINLAPDQATAVQDRVLARASGQTAGQLRAAVKRAIIAVDPAGAAERHEKAKAKRCVFVYPEEDGMASLSATVPAPDALSAYEWLTRLARGMGAEDPRGMDARRSDLMIALLTGRLTVATPGGESDVRDDAPGRMAVPAPVNPGKPLIQVVIPHTTLNGTAEHPAELVGYGPIPAPLAREIAADGVWKRLITDPLSGALLDHGRETYRPPAALADFVRARDVHCRNPVCRRRAIDSELDHTIAFAGDGGVTSEFNLYAACPYHHHLKHNAVGWKVVQHRDGRVTWTTPTGHSYTSSPYDYRIDDESEVVFDHVRGMLEPHEPPPAPPPIAETEPPFRRA